MANLIRIQHQNAPGISDPYGDAQRQQDYADLITAHSLRPHYAGTGTNAQAIQMGLTQLAEALLGHTLQNKAGEAADSADATQRQSNKALVDALAGPGVLKGGEANLPITLDAVPQPTAQFQAPDLSKAPAAPSLTAPTQDQATTMNAPVAVPDQLNPAHAGLAAAIAAMDPRTAGATLSAAMLRNALPDPALVEAQKLRRDTLAAAEQDRAATRDAQAAAAAEHKTEFAQTDARLASTEKQAHLDRMATLAAQQQMAAQGGKPPAGYRLKPDGSGDLEAIPGGPADKGAAGLAGREGVFLQRTMNAANGGLQDLKNIVELPIGASQGFVGIGKSPGESVIQASYDTLRNKLSPQSVQDYNTMMAGLSRNLATIETAGLSPSGSLTTSMDSIMLRDGDSGLTKLRKLAQGRQIIERGIETNLANPKIPDDQKAIIRGIISDIQTAIPFTQHDITELQRKQVDNPGLTLADLAKQHGLGSASAPKVTNDADYAKIPVGAQYTAPDGSVRTKQ